MRTDYHTHKFWTRLKADDNSYSLLLAAYPALQKIATPKELHRFKQHLMTYADTLDLINFSETAQLTKVCYTISFNELGLGQQVDLFSTTKGVDQAGGKLVFETETAALRCINGYGLDRTRWRAVNNLILFKKVYTEVIFYPNRLYKNNAGFVYGCEQPACPGVTPPFSYKYLTNKRQYLLNKIERKLDQPIAALMFILLR